MRKYFWAYVLIGDKCLRARNIVFITGTLRGYGPYLLARRKFSRCLISYSSFQHLYLHHYLATSTSFCIPSWHQVRSTRPSECTCKKRARVSKALMPAVLDARARSSHRHLLLFSFCMAFAVPISLACFGPYYEGSGYMLFCIESLEGQRDKWVALLKKVV